MIKSLNEPFNIKCKLILEILRYFTEPSLGLAFNINGKHNARLVLCVFDVTGNKLSWMVTIAWYSGVPEPYNINHLLQQQVDTVIQSQMLKATQFP